jgi:hypothetical protein
MSLPPTWSRASRRITARCHNAADRLCSVGYELVEFGDDGEKSKLT